MKTYLVLLLLIFSSGCYTFESCLKYCHDQQECIASCYKAHAQELSVDSPTPVPTVPCDLDPACLNFNYKIS